MARPVLDRSKPAHRTFGEDAHHFPFFQDGLYFDQKGNLMLNDHNREVLASRGIDIDDDTTATEPPKNPKLKGELAKKNPLEIFKAAERLRTQLDVEKHADGYQPQPGAKEDNIAFLLRHAE